MIFRQENIRFSMEAAMPVFISLEKTLVIPLDLQGVK